MIGLQGFKRRNAWIFALALSSIAQLYFVGDAHALSDKVTFGTDVHFAANSWAIPNAQFKTLERVGCFARNVQLEALVLVGHADPAERDAQKLSEKRAAAVRFALMGAGLPPGRVFAEAKGSRQPLTTSNASGPAKNRNRRVEIEISGRRKDGVEPSECVLAWQAQVLELPIAEAMTLVRSLIADEWVEPNDVGVLAATEGRANLLAAILAQDGGVSIDDRGRVAMVREAVRRNQLDALRTLIAQGVQLAEVGPRGRTLIWSVCQVSRREIDRDARLALVNELLQWGARPLVEVEDQREQSALACAAGQGDLGLVDVLLKAGADSSLPKPAPALVVAAWHPEVVKRMLDAGADPAVRTQDGQTLFHRYKLEKASDVAWLLHLGLNVRDVTRSGDTPLTSAARYATPEVLDALLAAGADIQGPDLAMRIVQSAWDNPKGLEWFVNHGISLQKLPDFLSQQAERGDSRSGVVKAVFRRNEQSEATSDEQLARALALAIRKLAPEMVQLLVDRGALRRFSQSSQPAGLTAIEYAERASLYVDPPPSFATTPEQEADRQRLNTPALFDARQRLKDQVIRILKLAEATK